MKKTKIKGVIAVAIMTVMMLSLFMSRAKAEGEYTITFTATGTHTVTAEGGHLKVDGQFVDPKLSSNPSGNFNGYTCTDNGSGVVQMTITGGEEVVLNFNSGNAYDLCIGDTTINPDTRISGATSIQVKDHATQPVLEDININATFNGTEGEIVFNNGAGRTQEGRGFDGILQNAGYTDASQKNDITINTSFSMPVATKVTINGTDYTFSDGEDSHTIQVDGAQSYTIVIQSDSSIETRKTVIWTNPDYVPQTEEDAQWVRDFSIGHGYAKAIAVYDRENNKLSPNQYINPGTQPDGSRSDEYGLSNGFGWVAIMPGSRVVFEFVPEYGYQLTSISINEQEVAAATEMNRFEFTMPDGSGNIHFSATFSKTEDVLKANSAVVSDGSINLGNELDGGSAQLSVSDVELPADKIKGFSEAAGEYSVKTFLDIDLYQVFYKGKDDSDDVWSNKIDELDNEATISIKLADGLTADDIVIVHNVHDGDEYEVIEIESYDEATNTITFKTKSFSNYAIATKGEKKSNSKLPKTGDSIVTIITAIAAATLGLFVAIKVKKNSKNVK